MNAVICLFKLLGCKLKPKLWNTETPLMHDKVLLALLNNWKLKESKRILPLQQRTNVDVFCFPLCSERSTKRQDIGSYISICIHMGREWERESTSDKGTPPAVTNSSLNWPFITNKCLSFEKIKTNFENWEQTVFPSVSSPCQQLPMYNA